MPPMIKETPRRTEKPDEEYIWVVNFMVNKLDWRELHYGLEFRLQRKTFWVK